MLVWRIVPKRRYSQAFSGEGARLHGGRWNPPGVRVVYTSATLSLAALEFFVHVSKETRPDELVSISLEIPKTVRIERVSESKLPPNWRIYPAMDELKEIGRKWIKNGATAILVVPSAVIPQELNYLINPDHPDFKKMKISKPVPFNLDERMFATL
jgi:RES domain-containing protein